MMNLEVRVALLDGITKPARDAERRLAGIGHRAEQLAGRFAGLTRATQGLAGAVRGLAAADHALAGSTASMGRLRGSMAGLSPAATTATTRIARLSRTVDNLAVSATKATGTVAALHGALARTVSGGGFVAAAHRQMADLVALQQQALAGMSKLNSGSGGAGRRGVVSGVGGGSGGHGGPSLAFDVHGLGSFARTAVAGAEDAENALVQLRMSGLSADKVERVKALAQQVAATNPMTTFAENVRGFLEARTALSGDFEEAIKLLPTVTKYSAVFAHAGGKGDQIAAAKNAVYSALRAGELRNIANDPERMNGLLSGIMGASIASDGRITPQMFASNIQYARSAGLNLSDKFTNLTLPFLMAELSNGGKGSHGGQAGNALMSAYSAIVQSRMTGPAVSEWQKLGYVKDGDVDKHGHLGAGKLKGADEFMSDPREFFRHLQEAMAAHGISGQTAILKELSALFGNRVAAGFADLMSLQESRIAGFNEMSTAAGAGDPHAIDAKYQMILAELSTSAAGLHHAFERLQTTAIAPFIPVLSSATRGLTAFTSATQSILSKFLGVANDPSDPHKSGLGIGGIATIAGGAAWSLGTLVTRAPWLATLMGQGAVGASAGPVAGFLARGTIKETVAAFSKALTSTIGAGLMRALGRGVLGGLILEAASWAIGKAVDAFRDKVASKERQFRADRFNEQGFLQKFGLFGGSSDPMDPRFAPPADVPSDPSLDSRRPAGQRRPGVLDTGRLPLMQLPALPGGMPLAGHRAAGGPVRRGLSYLVGERGPEVFTPGASGGVSTNKALGLMLSTSGSDGKDGDEKTAREVRFLSFALCSAVDSIAKSLDRLGRGRTIGEDVDAGSDGGGAGGGHAGGRHGLMSRMGAPSGAGGRSFAGNPGVGHWWTKDRTAHAVDRLVKEAHLSQAGAEGLVSRWATVEAAGGPTAVNPKSGAWGIGQWLGSRGGGRTADYDGQLTKAIGELNGPEKRAAARLRSAASARDAAVGASMFERAEHYNAHTGVDDWTSKSEAGHARIKGILSGTGEPRGTMAGIGGKGGEGIVARAMSLVGANGARAGSALGSRMTPNAWCADFVNGVLKGQGLKGNGSSWAPNFARYGRAVEKAGIRAGDILVQSGHVGIATGKTDGRGRIGMVSGNYGHSHGRSEVMEDYVSPSSIVAARRAEQPAIPPALADHVRDRGRRERERDARAAVNSRQAVAHGPISIAVHAQPHHDERKVAAMVHDRFNDSIRSQLHDGAYG